MQQLELVAQLQQPTNSTPHQQQPAWLLQPRQLAPAISLPPLLLRALSLAQHLLLKQLSLLLTPLLLEQ